MFPNIALAAGTLTANAEAFRDRAMIVIVQPLIGFMFALALVMFLYGVMRFVATSDKSSDDANKGRQHMLWGIIGMFVMAAVFGIMRLILRTLGMDA